MKFKMVHENYNVANLEKSMAFYEKALGLKEAVRKKGDGFTIVYMQNEESSFQLELTQLDEHPQPYDLGECEFHLAFVTDDFEAAINYTKKWDVSALKTLLWASTLSKTLTDTGWKLSQQENNRRITHIYKTALHSMSAGRFLLYKKTTR